MTQLPRAYAEIRRRILFENMEKYKDTSNRSLAKIMHRDYPEFFNNIEHARSIIRLYKGKSGEPNKKNVKETKFFTNEKPMA